MNIALLSKAYPVCSVSGNSSLEITNIVYDSRKVRPGTLFVAIKGARQDGHDYLQQAVIQGAVALIVTDAKITVEDIDPEGKYDFALVLVEDSRDALAFIASSFYQDPSSRLKLIACTGVRGRHALASMIYAIWRGEGIQIAYLSGMTINTPEGLIYSSRNRPESLEFQASFAELAEHGMTTAVLPISPLDFSLKRAAHTSLEAIILMHAPAWDEKLGLEVSRNSKHFIINIDEPLNEIFLAKLNHEEKRRAFISFAIDRKADFRATNLRICRRDGRLGTLYTLEIHGQASYEVFVGLPGRFNVLNSLASLALVSVCALSLNRAISAFATLNTAGRTEAVDNDQDLDIYIDTAWTASSMENLLTAIRPYCQKRILLVCGSGGDRDRKSRIDLGMTAGRLADHSYLTVTNERSEGAASVISDLEKGILETGASYELHANRQDAIDKAIKEMEKGDILLISGKGSEGYQISAEETLAYSDRAVAEAALKRRLLEEGDV